MSAPTVQSSRSFLTLCQDTFRECGAYGTVPTTIVGATGEWQRIVNWVHDAELDIQNLWVDWKWLRKTLTCYTFANSNVGIATTLNGAVSAQPTDLAEWDFKLFQIQPSGSTQYQPLQVDEWFDVRHEVFDLTDTAQPWRAIVMPDNTLRWDLTPDLSYLLSIEYRSVPYDLKLDGDISNIPPRFANRLIVELARLKYGWFENAQEQIALSKLMVMGDTNAAGVQTVAGLLAQLENDQLPNAKNGRLQQGNDIVIGGDYYSYGDQGY